MEVELAYGRDGLRINLPDKANVTVLSPRYTAGVTDPSAALIDALENPVLCKPLREMVKPSDKVGIVFSDITRPTPSSLFITALYSHLDHLKDKQIILFNATGTHRANTDDELRAMLGNEIISRFRIVQNDCSAPDTHMHLGTTRGGNDIWVNSEFIACDVRILTGFIEPHFFAGFSGGGKALIPGMARLDTVQRNHGAANIDNRKSTWGVTSGNPLWEDIYEGASFAEPSFLLNVALNKDKQITRVFAGDFTAAHRQGCEFVRETAMAAVDSPFDIVITTNSGYPLDQNLYQAVKGISAAGQVVRDGGSIIIAAECSDGIPNNSEYYRLLTEFDDYNVLLDCIRTPGFHRAEMWQVQIQALIGRKTDIHLYSSNLTDEQISRCKMIPCRSIEQTLSGLLVKYGSDARICVIPEGPQTIPYLKA